MDAESRRFVRMVGLLTAQQRKALLANFRQTAGNDTARPTTYFALLARGLMEYDEASAKASGEWFAGWILTDMGHQVAAWLATQPERDGRGT